MTPEENINLVENMEVGTKVAFHTSSNDDRKLYIGTVSRHKGLGLVVVLPEGTFELRKAINLQII